LSLEIKASDDIRFHLFLKNLWEVVLYHNIILQVSSD
jgi:hypothetical protein